MLTFAKKTVYLFMCRNRVDWVAAWTHIQCRNTGASNDISSESGSELSQVWLSAWAIQSLGFFFVRFTE